MARTAAFTKLVALRKRLRKMIEFWEDTAEESGRLMHSLIQQVELIDFYLHKIEFYFSKKQQECDEEMGSGANKRTNADSDDSDGNLEKERMASIQEDDAEYQDESKGSPLKPPKSRSARKTTTAP